MAIEHGWTLIISVVLDGEIIAIDLSPQFDCVTVASQWLDAAFAWEKRNHIEVAPAYMCVAPDPPMIWRAHR